MKTIVAIFVISASISTTLFLLARYGNIEISKDWIHVYAFANMASFFVAMIALMAMLVKAYEYLVTLIIKRSLK
jgi:hypothetical protein